MITRDDAVLALSNSGETAEILTILPVIKRLGVPLIAFTGNSDSALARIATVHLDIRVPAEACPLNLAPTASTTAALAVGDALAVALLKARGFTEEDFARSHPAGALGRRLLYVKDVMRTGVHMPKVRADTTLAEGLLEVTSKGLGMTAIVDDAERVLGVFTDGDLRRALDRAADLHSHPHGSGHDRASRNRCSPATLAAEAVHLMETHRITSLVVIDDGRQDRRRAQRARSAARGCVLKARTATPLAKIQLLILDVDGVLTDGRLYFGIQG